MSVNRVMTLFIVLTMTIPIGQQFGDPIFTQKASHDFWLEPLSHKSFPITIMSNSTMSGEFKILVDGDQYTGDQQKYDLWPIVQGIILMVFLDSEYQNWLEDQNATAVLTRNGYPALSWNTGVIEAGDYQVVYSNDAITRKRIQGQIMVSNELSQLLDYIFIPSSVFLVVTIIVILINLYRRRRAQTKPVRKRKRTAA